MAFCSIFRGTSKTLQVYSKYYFIAGQQLKPNIALSSFKLQPYWPQSTFTAVQKNNFTAPLLQNVNIQQYSANLQHVKSFAANPGPHVEEEEGSHTRLWSAQRIFAAVMLGIIPCAFIFPSRIMDCVLAVTLVLHNHWGIENVVEDYVNPKVFGSLIPKISIALTYLLSITTLVGLFYLNINDCGIVKTIELIWHLKE